MKNLIAIVALAVAGCNYTKSTVRFPDGHSVTIKVERPEHYQDEEIEIITKGNRLFYSYQPNPQPLNSSETIMQNAETALQNAPARYGTRALPRMPRTGDAASSPLRRGMEPAPYHRAA